MKITSVDIIEVANSLRSANSKWRPVVVRINTDEGIYGYGEVGLAYGVGASAGFGMAKDLARTIIGKNPMNNEAIWHDMYSKTFWGQGGGAVVYAGFSGIDAALWDIKGKALGVPLSVLLGGKCREKIRAYASQLQFGWGRSKEKQTLIEPEQYAAAALTAMADGYTAIKVDPLGMDLNGKWIGWNLTGVLSAQQVRTGYNRIKAIREAAGPDLDIIVEMHAFTDTTSAIQFGRAIEELGVFYYEEPVTPLSAEQMKKVAEKVDIPLAGGERVFTRWGYRPFFENGSIDVIQPDLGTCGGVTEGKKLCDMAHTYDVTVQAHVCGGPMATAIALQLEAAIPNFIIHEVHRYSLLEDNIKSCIYDYQPVDGYYDVPNLPGIGQDLSQDVLRESIVETVK
ncbi:MAG: mandelate racemase/muconate lactonizing enzyme family protein [Clostridia bacterium]|nr:mandelate racemase/muconate lactonizing enzyme family protein [Clostridia bacterium]